MKLILKFLGIALLLFVVISSCKKTLSDTQYNGKEDFDAAAAKEWYYGVFKKSPEWKSSPEAGKKLPVWKYSNYRKVGGLEIVEFSLTKEKSSFPMYFMPDISLSERQRVAQSSLSKIVFIKNSNQEIFVRELDIIPSAAYAKTNDYDLSELNFGKNFAFSGIIVTKKWNGEILSNRKWEDGKNIGIFTTRKVSGLEKSKNNNGNTNNLDNCTITEVCNEVLTDGWCENEGDNVVCHAGHWITVCHDVEICTSDDEPGCNYDLEESCACQLYNTGCSGGGGGGDNPPPPPPPQTCSDCGNITSEEAISQLNAITSSCDNIIGNPTIGASTFNASGIEKKPWASNGCNYIVQNLGLWSSTFTPKYTGIIKRQNTTSQWKFDEFKFNGVVMTDGQLPLCYSYTLSENIQEGIIENGLKAEAVGSFTLEFKISCTFWQNGSHIQSKTINLGYEKFSAN